MPNALVVDDSKAVRIILTKVLRELGYTVAEAGNGREALAILRASAAPVELVLADWNMPEMNGFEMLKEIRRDPALAAVLIVMVTTESELDKMTAALDAGANEYVMKPFTKEILVEKLQLVGAHA